MNLDQVRTTAEKQLSLSGYSSGLRDSGEASTRIENILPISEKSLLHLQKKIALRNCGRIDPEDINHYIVYGQGYAGLSNALGRNPKDLIQTSIQSALKGRRGLGCSTPKKWEAFADAIQENKCLICNAVDPDPKSRISRLLLESDPHSVLEGMLIGAYATGASRCILLVEEKIDAAPKLRKALDQMKVCNLLGSNILNSQFHAEIEIVVIPEIAIAGQQIDVLRCLDEAEPLAHFLPVHPVSSIFRGKTVLITNPETMSCLAAILGDEGIDAEQGSKAVTLTGSVLNTGVTEVAHGTTIQSIINLFGGGVATCKTIKAVQLGGPSGYFIPPGAVNHAIGCDACDESYSNIGSGTIEVLDSDAGILKTVTDIMAYLQAQSCGRCVFCREGCLQILTILEDISENRSRPRDLELLVELGEEMKKSSLCDFGRTAPNAVLSSIELFRDAYK